jgi:hypothetical protein
MQSEGRPHRLGVVFPPAGRAFDVGEQKSHRAPRPTHMPTLRLSASAHCPDHHQQTRIASGRSPASHRC